MKFYSTYKEHIYVNFAGVSFFYSEPLGLSQTFRVYCSYASGMAHYRNETEKSPKQDYNLEGWFMETIVL